MEVLGGPVVEVGPAHTDLPNVTEAQPGSGPLAALAAGWTALTSDGWTAPAVVVATDIPRLTAGLLSWLAGCPGSASVIPVLAGRPQLLCARYGPSDLHRAVELVATGERAVTALLTTSDALLVEEAEWAGPAGDPWAVRDADTPHELDELTAGPGALRR
jgi:molybdopterin-guanine dinucleotide biosynthesis protein A